MLDKNNFWRKDLLGSNALFNYLASFVCEDILKNTDEGSILCFDDRTIRTSSKHSLPGYLESKAIEWGVEIKFNVCFYQSECHRGIQIADLIANTIYQKYKNDQNHFYKELNIKKSIKFPYQQFGD